MLSAGRLADAREKDRTHVVEALGWVVAAVVCSVTVGPFVVTGRVDESALERFIQREPMQDELVVASLAARLDIACVHHEVDVVVSIDLRNESGELLLPGRAVRHVADQREREWRNAASPIRRLLGGNAPAQSQQGQADDRTDVPDSHGDSLRWLSRSSR